MNKIKILVLVLGLMYLTGCDLTNFARVSLLNDNQTLKIEVVNSPHYDNEKELLAEGYTKVNFPKTLFEQDVYSVIPENQRKKFKLNFSDGIFIVDRAGKTYGLNKDYLKKNQSSGKIVQFTKTGEESYEINIPLEKMSDTGLVSGIALYCYYKPWLEWIDITNFIHDDSDQAKMLYIPFYSVRKMETGSTQFILSQKEAKASDIGNGMIMFGSINLNSEKDREYAIDRTKAENFYFYNNYGSNFVVPIFGIINTNRCNKLEGDPKDDDIVSRFFSWMYLAKRVQ